MKFFVTFLFLTFLIFPANAQQSYLHVHGDNDFRKGMELLEKEKFNTAQKFFERSLETYGNTDSELRTLSQYYIAYCAVRLFNEDSEFLTMEFIRKNPESPLINEALFNLAGYFYARKKWKDAVTYYNQSDPDKLTRDQWAEYYFKLGYSYYMLKDTDKAKPILYRITDIDTKYTPPALYFYSHIHYEEENYQTALNGFLRLAEDKTFGSIAPYYIIQIYYKQEKYKEIVEFAPGMIGNVTDKRLAEVSRITAEAYAQLGRYEESLPYFQTFLDSADFVTKEDKYQAGYAFYKAGRHEEAIDLFRSISSTDSRLGQNAAYYLADCYLRTGDKQNARLAFHSASRMPYDKSIQQDALFNYALITYELSTDPFNEAIRAFEDFIKLYPESKRIDEAYRFLVQSYLNARNYKLALESLEKTDLGSDDMKEAYQKIAYYRGIEQLNNLEYSQAIQQFDKSLRYGSHNELLKAKAQYWEGETYYRMKAYREALQCFSDFRNSSVAYTTDEFDYLDYNVGYAYFHLSQYDKAIEYFRKFVSGASSGLAKEKGDALNRTGDSFYAQSDYYSASDYYSRAAQTAETDVEYALLQKGICEGLSNKDIQKIKTLQQLVADYPNSNYVDDALFEIAQSYVKMADTRQAIENLGKMVSGHPESELAPEAYVQLGLLYYNSDNNQAAIRYYKETVSKYPGSVAAKDALVGLKTIYVDINQVDEYFAFVNGLGKMAPVISAGEQDSLSYVSAEKVYMAGNCKEAARAFEKYTIRYPGGKYLLNAHFYKGECNYRAKEFDEALNSFQYVIRQPDNEFTEQALLGAARIQTDRGEYAASIDLYSRAARKYPAPANKKEAYVAVMRSQYKLENFGEALDASRKVLTLSKLPPELIREAHYIAARSLQETGRDVLATEEYRKISNEVMSVEGA
ncbi:MAG: tetratricopeptide repeat protein, partial [Bacteroidales bacterium]